MSGGRSALSISEPLQRGEINPFARKRGRRALRGVDDRAAADGHEPVAAALRVKTRRLVHHVQRGIGRHLVEHLVGHAGGVEHARELGRHAQLHQALVGHDERALHAAVGQLARQLVQRTLSAYDLRGAEELESLHGSPFRRFAKRRSGSTLRGAAAPGCETGCFRAPRRFSLTLLGLRHARPLCYSGVRHLARAAARGAR